MSLTKTIRLIGSFYKSFFIFSFLVNVACLSIFWQNGFSVFAGLFWLKTSTLGLTWYFISDYKKKELYYYYNQGLSSALLWTTTLSFDFLFFIFLIILSYQLK